MSPIKNNQKIRRLKVLLNAQGLNTSKHQLTKSLNIFVFTSISCRFTPHKIPQHLNKEFFIGMNN